MDFNLDEDLQALGGLAAEIFDDLADTDRVRAVEAGRAGQDRVDDALWAALGQAGLLALTVPEEYGGAGLGLDALAVVLEEQGRHVAPVPLWSAAVAAEAVARFGTAEQRAAVLPGVAAGEARIALALEEYEGAEPESPRTSAVADGSGYLLTGVKAVVPTVAGADRILVSATAEAGPGLFLVAADAACLTVERSDTTMYDLAGEVLLDGVRAEAVGTPGDGALGVTLRVAAIALAALQVGVADGALGLAASYLSTREQFGRPLGTFQAVQHQLADCWIDIDAMRVTLWQALASDAVDSTGTDPLRAAERAAWVAKWWCDQAGLDVVHRTQHVHGGMGIDTDYPVHRHFLWGKQLSSTLGGASSALAGLGSLLATTEVSS
jgi:3-oxocholest-4-en-26-oyl-CoA dehydrogenase beta subunit